MATTAKRGAAKEQQAAIRGRLSERMWADVRHAARLAHEEGVVVRVHGVEVGCGLLKQHSRSALRRPRQGQKQPADAAKPPLPPATAGDAPAEPLTR